MTDLTPNPQSPAPAPALRMDWTIADALALLNRPFNDLLFEAQSIHRQHFDPNEIQASALLSIKTGGCPEDCGYCAQSMKNDSSVDPGGLIALQEVIEAATAAKAQGASRFCMGAAWRRPGNSSLSRVIEMIEAVRALGLETCATLGMLTPDQATRLKDSGLDYYNHNIDTSPEYYAKIITTRTFQDRLDTLNHVREAGINVCSGVILGMGESFEDRAKMLRVLANQPEHPQSVPINLLVPIKGTPLENTPPLDIFELVRVVAAARIMMPRAYVRLSAGREAMSDEAQALCFLAGANSFFHGEQLLTTPNAKPGRDAGLLKRLGVTLEKPSNL
ncbi:MAG: biotin synthase BioB [Hyphomicrobiaceae bacterium]|nr:biotin synthase BioB [Hyphomicrobiaceae bacterium]